MYDISKMLGCFLITQLLIFERVYQKLFGELLSICLARLVFINGWFYWTSSKPPSHFVNLIECALSFERIDVIYYYYFCCCSCYDWSEWYVCSFDFLFFAYMSLLFAFIGCDEPKCYFAIKKMTSQNYFCVVSFTFDIFRPQ